MDDGVVAAPVAGLRYRDVHQVPALVKVDGYGLPDGDDVLIEPPHRRPKRHGGGERDFLDYRFGRIFKPRIKEARVERDRRLRRRSQVQESHPHLWGFAGLIVNHILAVGRGCQQLPLRFAVRLPVEGKGSLGVIPRRLPTDYGRP